MNMRAFVLAVIASVVATCTAFALTPVEQLLLFQQSNATHDGISLDFTKSLDACCYVKSPGAPAQRAPFTTLFQFSRNSVGTFLGSNGLIQYARENLFQFSEDASNAYWTKNAATISANSTTAPDGTTTADTLVADAGVGTLPRVSNTSFFLNPGVKTTVSVYAKASTYDFVQIYFNGQAADWANFNVTTCAVGTSGGAVTLYVQSVGDGWCRISVTFIPGNTDRRPFFLLAASASATRAQTWSPAGTEAVFFWGMMTARGPLPQQYLAATGAAQKYDQPRIEYDASGNTLGLLIEGLRTTLILWSEDFTDAAWVNANTTDAANTAVAPDGNTTADTITATAGGGYIKQNFQTNATSAVHTFSDYLQRKTGTGAITLEVGAVSATCTVAAGTWNRCTVTGAIIAGTYSITSNVVTVAATAHGLVTGDAAYLDYTSGTAADFSCASVTVTGVDAFTCPQTTADTTGNVNEHAETGRIKFATNGDGVYSWGAGSESAPFASSYIPTTTASVSRSADVALCNSCEGYINRSSGSMSVTFTNKFVYTISVGAHVFFQSSLNGYYYINVNNASLQVFDGTTNGFYGVFKPPIDSGLQGNTHRMMATYGGNRMNGAVDGGGIATETAFDGAMGAVGDALYLGSKNGSSPADANIKNFDFYPYQVPLGTMNKKTAGPQSALKWPSYVLLPPSNDNQVKKAA